MLDVARDHDMISRERHRRDHQIDVTFLGLVLFQNSLEHFGIFFIEEKHLKLCDKLL